RGRSLPGPHVPGNVAPADDPLSHSEAATERGVAGGAQLPLNAIGAVAGGHERLPHEVHRSGVASVGNEVLDTKRGAKGADLFFRMERHRLLPGPRMSDSEEVPREPSTRPQRLGDLPPELRKVLGRTERKAQSGPDQVGGRKLHVLERR